MHGPEAGGRWAIVTINETSLVGAYALVWALTHPHPGLHGLTGDWTMLTRRPFYYSLTTFESRLKAGPLLLRNILPGGERSAGLGHRGG